MEYTYDDLLDRLTDLKALAVPPAVGETSGCFSSYDRRSRYNEATGLYEDWGANSDGDGYIRREGEDIVALEIDGPGVIWRAWSANPQMGHIRVYIDGAAAPALDMPFRDLFERFDAEGDQFWPANFPRLMPTLSRGRNRFIPICFSTGCKITLGPSWGMFYHFTYTKFPAGTVAPAYSAALERAAQTRLAEIDRALALRGKLPMDGMEWRQVPCTAGESTVLYQSDTPGALTAFALEVPEGMPPAALENLLVEMYWDGAAQPSVACPLPNLFACTAAGAEDFRCLPVAKSGGLYACFWYMPFASAKIVLCNAGGTDTLLRVGCRTKTIPGGEAAGLLRYCARTHSDAFGGLDAARFAPGGDRWPDWPLLRCQGRGRLCGVHLAVDNRWPEPDKPADEWWYGVGQNKTIDWWWGEGDEKFFVDGEAFPSTFGTGSEDYIGYAWAAEPPFSLVDSAFAVQNAVPLTGNGMTSVARFHIVDNIPFQNELEAYIEKYKANTWDDSRAVCEYRATCYWYMAAGGKEKGHP